MAQGINAAASQAKDTLVSEIEEMRPLKYGYDAGHVEDCSRVPDSGSETSWGPEAMSEEECAPFLQMPSPLIWKQAMENYMW